MLDNERTPNEYADDEPIAIQLVIPNAIDCTPPRTSRVGGIARIHPSWSAISTEPNITTMETPNWGKGKVESVQTRSAVTFHRRMGSFAAISVKTGRSMSGLGPYEQMVSEELETDPNIVDYSLQGLRLTWPDGSSYLSDFHAHDALSGIVVGEVKADASYFIDPGYMTTMANTERTLAAVGFGFRKVDGGELAGMQIRRANVRRAYADRFSTVGDARTDQVRNMLAGDGEVALGQVHAVLANDPRTAQQLVHALLCRRVLAYDLDQPLSRDTLVTTPPVPAMRSDIRAISVSEED